MPVVDLDLNVDMDRIKGAEVHVSIHRILARYTQQQDVKFILGDQVVRSEMVFQPECLLPVVALEAERIWQTLSVRPGRADVFNGPLDTVFERTQNGYFPYLAHPPSITADVSSSFRLAVFLLAARRVFALKEGESINLAPFIEAWDKIDWKSAELTGELPDIPMPVGFDMEFQMQEFKSRRADHSHRSRALQTSFIPPAGVPSPFIT